MSANDIRKIGVLGAGQMGLGIAQVTAKAGFETVLVKATPGDTQALHDRVAGAYGRDVDKGRMEADARDAALGRLSVGTDLAAMGDCDLITIADFPDDATAATFALRLGAKGNTRTTTMKAFPEEALMEIIKAV